MRLHTERWGSQAAHYLSGCSDLPLMAYANTPAIVASKLGDDPWGAATFLPGDPDLERVIRWLAPECPDKQHLMLAPSQASDLLQSEDLGVTLMRDPLYGAFSCQPGQWWKFWWSAGGTGEQGHVRHEDLVAALS